MQVLKPKRPVRGELASEKVDIEGVEDSRFLIVVMKLTTIVLNQLDLVASMALVGASMKIAGVLVPFKSSPHFTPLLPKQQLSLSGPAEDGNNERSEIELRGGECSRFFHMI